MNESSLAPLPWRRHVVLRRSARARYVRLKLLPSGKIELVMPRGFDEREVPAILDHYEPWVLRNLERMGPRGPAGPAEAPGLLHLPAIAEEWSLEYIDDDSGRYGCRTSGDGTLRVSGGLHWQQALKRWLARQGKQHLLPWLEQVSEELELPYSGASIRGQRTRWGSCSSRGHINLNFALLFLSPELVHYLFVHELCHTRHMNHSARYWRLVAQKQPDYRDLDRKLRKAFSQVPAWLHATEIVQAT